MQKLSKSQYPTGQVNNIKSSSKMHRALIILGLVAVAYAGVGKLTPAIEAEALRLWQAHCTGSSDRGSDGNADIFCKISKDVVPVRTTVTKTLPNPEQPRDQIVFVQPPTYNYEHEVLINGQLPSQAKTVIYVRPSKIQNEVVVTPQITPGAPAPKPSLYFLKGEGSNSAATGYSQPESQLSPRRPQGYYARSRRGNAEAVPVADNAEPEQPQDQFIEDEIIAPEERQN